MNVKNMKLAAVIGGSAAVSAAAIGVAILQGPASSIASDMETGVTVTETTAPSVVGVPEAVPSIKGPAPLPTEEQGLPG